MNKGSRTALSSGATRAAHLLWDESPHVLVDPFTLFLLPEETRRLMLVSRRNGGDHYPALRSSVIWRARTTEDALDRAMERGVRQYAILGAGFDSFAWRRGELLPDLQVFEIDQAPTQAWKRECLAEMLVKVPEGLHFIPADLATTSVPDALAQSCWDFAQPGFFCWTGVTMYLRPEAVSAVLRDIAALGPGTGISFTFLQHENQLDETSRAMLNIIRTSAEKSGEYYQSHYAPREIEAVAREAGFNTIEHHDPKSSPHFRNRRDGLMPHSVELLVVATV